LARAVFSSMFAWPLDNDAQVDVDISSTDASRFVRDGALHPPEALVSTRLREHVTQYGS
jgi:hypothetical protein